MKVRGPCIVQLIYAVLACVAIAGHPLESHAQKSVEAGWVLPAILNDYNTVINYRYNAFGKQNAGRSDGVRGKVWLANSDLRSVKAQITVPTPNLNSLTQNSLNIFSGILNGVQLPPVVVSINTITNLCSPKDILPAHPCSAVLVGEVQFGSVIRALNQPVRIERGNDLFLIRGEGQLDRVAASQAVSLGQIIDSAMFSFRIELPG